MQQDRKSNEDEVNDIKRKQDDEISACFEAAKQKIGKLLTSKKQTIKDLARDLERLGRPVDHIAAEIVHELRNCEELSRSQIYSYLDDKYKNQTQAQRRKGKKESNPDPKTGTESPLEQTITVGNNGQQTVYNEHDTQELKEPADTPAESVTKNRPTSSQQSKPANLQKSDWNPDPKTGTESSLEQSADTTTTTDTKKLVSSISMPFEHLRRDMYAVSQRTNGMSNIFWKLSIDLATHVAKIEFCGITQQKDVTMTSTGKGILREAN